MEKTLSAVVAIALLVFAGVFAFKDTSVVVNVPETSSFGSNPSNEHDEPQFYYGGISGKVVNFVSTTTNACSVQNPTGKWVSFIASWQTTAATTTTTVLAIATSTNANRYATSTAILSRTVAAGATATTTYVGANNQNILGPGEWVHVGYGAGTTLPSVAQQQSGTCNILFYSIIP